MDYFKDVCYKIFRDENAQGSVEVLLLLGGVFVVVLVLIYIYNSYMNDLNSEISVNDLNELNNSFLELGSKFE